MRHAALLVAALIAQPVFAEVRGPTAEAVVKVTFPRGNPFPKHRLPQLQIVEAGSEKAVVSMRPREWSRTLATYAGRVPAGKTYGLRWARAAASFARLAIPIDPDGPVVFRVPYVPRSAPLAQSTEPAAMTLARAGR